jgi:hypothetical protein
METITPEGTYLAIGPYWGHISSAWLSFLLVKQTKAPHGVMALSITFDSMIIRKISPVLLSLFKNY